MYDTDEYKYVERVDQIRKQLRGERNTDDVLESILNLLEDLIREMPKQRDHGQD